MRILILEDEPMIALDLEDILLSEVEAEILHAVSLVEALEHLHDGVDFALLDVSLGERGENSLPVAEILAHHQIPFGFVSGSLEMVPQRFRTVPQVAKPFQAREVRRLVPAAA